MCRIMSRILILRYRSWKVTNSRNTVKLVCCITHILPIRYTWNKKQNARLIYIYRFLYSARSSQVIYIISYTLYQRLTFTKIIIIKHESYKNFKHYLLKKFSSSFDRCHVIHISGCFVKQNQCPKVEKKKSVQQNEMKIVVFSQLPYKHMYCTVIYSKCIYFHYNSPTDFSEARHLPPSVPPLYTWLLYVYRRLCILIAGYCRIHSSFQYGSAHTSKL
jgi:hypothetical protein